MSSKFTELIVDENSVIGAGTRIKLFENELTSFSALKETLSDCTKYDPVVHKLGYIDTESEVIELMDDCDWITCVEEATTTYPTTPIVGIIIVGKNQKWNRDQLALTSSMILTRSIAPTSTSPQKLELTSEPAFLGFESVYPSKPEAPQVLQQETPSPISESKPEPSQNSAKVDLIPPQQPVLSKSQSTQHPKEYSYRFSYTDTELELVRKVPINVFAQLEAILASKYEEGLVQGERAFKVFLEQQNKKKAIEHHKKVSEMQAKIDTLKKELAAAQIQTNGANQVTTMFSTAVLSPTTDAAVSSRKSSAAVQPGEGQGQKDKYLHLDVTCDGCGEFPMAGIRYKALEKQDHDLCEVCFLASADTKAPFLALRETVPNKLHKLTQLARASNLPNYQQDNSTFLRLHKWNDPEYKFKDLAFE